MIYSVFHKTTYSYNAPVTFARCVLRLRPGSSSSQSLLASSIRITPTPSARTERQGPFGEDTLSLVIDRPHTELVIEARSRVDVHPADPPAPGATPPWEEIRTLALATADLSPRSPASFLYPTSRTPLVGAITDYARQSFRPGRPVADAAAELMTRIRAEFVYDADATSVSTPIDAAFAQRRGVCQDFSHIMIAALRGLGLPAAYVSGYLRTLPPPGRARLEGADATHAWVRVWCGEAWGWLGFDPTNAMLALEEHITLAVGRDYADVAPIDGVMLGSGDQSLTVEVDVKPEAALVAR